MEPTLLSRLEDLKKPTTTEKIKETINLLHQESIAEMQDLAEEYAAALSGQSTKFYSELSEDFIEVLNDWPEDYFFVWDFYLSLLDEKSGATFYEQAKERAGKTQAGLYLRGFEAQGNDDLKGALTYFERIKSYVGQYFVAGCYFDLGSFNLCLAHYGKFQEEFQKLIGEINPDEYPHELVEWGIVMFHVNSIKAHCYFRQDKFDEAFECYALAEMIMEMEQQFNATSAEDRDDDVFLDRMIWYAQSAFMIGELDKAAEITRFVQEHYPENEEVQKWCKDSLQLYISMEPKKLPKL